MKVRQLVWDRSYKEFARSWHVAGRIVDTAHFAVIYGHSASSTYYDTEYDSYNRMFLLTGHIGTYWRYHGKKITLSASADDFCLMQSRLTTQLRNLKQVCL